MKQKFKIVSILLACLLLVSSWSNSISAYEWEDDDYEMSEDSDYVDIYDGEITLYVGDKYKLDYDYDCYYDPVWKSSDTEVARVNSNGKITAVGVGEAEITVLCGDSEDSVTVTVKKKVSYKSIAKKMKKFAKKNKGFKFDNIDVGTKCRLYGYSFTSSDDSKISSEGYAYVTAFRSYIQLTKKNGQPHIQLVIWGDVIELSVYDVSLDPYRLKLNTSNRILKFDLNSISTKDKYKKGVYTSNSKSYAVISSDTNVNKSVVNKYKKMLSQKSLKLKFSFDGGGYYQIPLIKKVRNNWKKLAAFHQKLLKEY